MKPKVVMVNENDEIIGHKLYKDIDFPNEIYRVSRLWVTDLEGNVLLQKRNLNMHFHPGLWACAAAGTNDEGETYEFNIVKEAKEEIGLDDVWPRFLKKQLEQHSGRNVFSAYFSYKVDDVRPDMQFDPEEVDTVQWYTPGELKELIDKDRQMFTPDVLDMFEYTAWDDKLFERLYQIDAECRSLCKMSMGHSLPVAGNIGIFCKNNDEYEKFLTVSKNLTNYFDDPNQKYFQLIYPIQIRNQNDLTLTKYTHLYIRKPDPSEYGKHSGDIDFIVPEADYKNLIASLKTGDKRPGMALYEYKPKDLELVELSSPEKAALAYIGTQKIAEAMRTR